MGSGEEEGILNCPPPPQNRPIGCHFRNFASWDLIISASKDLSRALILIFSDLTTGNFSAGGPAAKIGFQDNRIAFPQFCELGPENFVIETSCQGAYLIFIRFDDRQFFCRWTGSQNRISGTQLEQVRYYLGMNLETP